MYSIYKNNYIKYISILLILTLVLSSCGKGGSNIVKREDKERQESNEEKLKKAVDLGDTSPWALKEETSLRENISPLEEEKGKETEESEEKDKEKDTSKKDDKKGMTFTEVMALVSEGSGKVTGIGIIAEPIINRIGKFIKEVVSKSTTAYEKSVNEDPGIIGLVKRVKELKENPKLKLKENPKPKWWGWIQKLLFIFRGGGSAGVTIVNGIEFGEYIKDETIDVMDSRTEKRMDMLESDPLYAFVREEKLEQVIEKIRKKGEDEEAEKEDDDEDDDDEEEYKFTPNAFDREEKLEQVIEKIRKKGEDKEQTKELTTSMTTSLANKLANKWKKKR